MRQSLWKLFIVVLTVIVMTACSGGTQPQPKAAEAPATASQPGGSNQEPAAEAPKDDYPTKEIEWIIPFSPGSGADTFARALIRVTAKQLGQEIVPVNKEGGSTAVGVSYVLSKEADGYTVFSQSSTLPLLIASGQVPFTENDLKAITRINADYKVLAVNASSSLNNFEDFVAYAKEKPGSLKLGGVGTKSWSDAFAQKITAGADIKVNYIPYNGGSEVVAAVLGENLDAMVITSSNINAQVDAGELRILAVSLAERDSKRPDAPTFKELGYENIADDLLWRGVFGKAGIPQERLDILNAAFEKALQDPEWQAYMENEQQIDAFMTADPFSELVTKEVAEAKEFLAK